MSNPRLTQWMSSVVAHTASLVVLLAPALVLALAAQRHNSGLLAVGAVAVGLGSLLFVRHREVWRPPVSGSVILLYIMALGWLWFATHNTADGFVRAARGGLLVAAVGLVVLHDLTRTGLGPRRRARRLCERILRRTNWPLQPAAFADLSEVRALQDAVRDDPSPALGLLKDERPEIRMAGFTALTGRPYWRAGEAAMALNAIRSTPEPTVRAVGVSALAASEDPETEFGLTSFLNDQAAEVREAAVLALLSDGVRRWPNIREAVRQTLADPNLASEGALPGSAGRLPPMAICDLTAWAVEPEPLAERSIRTLIRHYAAALRMGDRHELPYELAMLVTDPQTPPVLRLELAGLLREVGLVPAELLDRMTDLDQPGPVRLMGAEMILAQDPGNADAIDVLRGLGRQSNRETVLAIARLLQTYLNLDMGLPEGKVPPNGKAAAEAARRVFQWATGRAGQMPAMMPTPAPSPADRAPRPPASSLAGLRQTSIPTARRSSGSIWAPK